MKFHWISLKSNLFPLLFVIIWLKSEAIDVSGSIPVYDNSITVSSNSSPKRVKVLPEQWNSIPCTQIHSWRGSLTGRIGTSPPTPTTTAKSSSKLTTALATPSQRSKLQKIVEFGKYSGNHWDFAGESWKKRREWEAKGDSVSDAIEDIISQK